MKLTYTKKYLLLICFIIFGVNIAKGQTTLAKGDIAFTGFVGNGASAANDQFSFVLLKNIITGTVINFTDNGWLRTSSTTGSFRSGEGTITWTSNAAYPAGTEIKMDVNIATPFTTTATYAYYALGTPTINGSAGTATGSTAAATFSFSANGDAIIAYQGTAASPTFISAIQMNVYSVATGIPGVPGGDAVTTTTADWDGAFSNTNASGLPALTSVSANNFLTNGVDAIWIPGTIAAEVDNTRFNCSGPLTTIAQVKTSLFTVANWTTSDNIPAFTLPTSCNFLGLVLPIKLISFKAQNILTDVQLNWSATDQTDFSHFELERSFDGNDFKYLTTIAALHGTGNIDYTYTDKAILKANESTIYYRLKMVDVDGKITYSDIVKLSNGKPKDFEITNFQNPLIGNKINFALLTKINQRALFSITDLFGRQLYIMQQNCNAGRNQITFPDNLSLANGIYFLNIQLDNEPKKSVKFVKN